MAMLYKDICPEVRALMIDEINLDGDGLYRSAYFTPAGVAAWKNMLVESCRSGSDVSLAAAIKSGPYLLSRHPRRTKNGISFASVPFDAHETIAESNFSRFYLRALCRFALSKGMESLIGYRAMAVATPRAGSQQKIGAHFDAAVTLADLRATMSSAPLGGMPPGVGSGILACLP